MNRYWYLLAQVPELFSDIAGAGRVHDRNFHGTRTKCRRSGSLHEPSTDTTTTNSTKMLQINCTKKKLDKNITGAIPVQNNPQATHAQLYVPARCVEFSFLHVLALYTSKPNGKSAPKKDKSIRPSKRRHTITEIYINIVCYTCKLQKYMADKRPGSKREHSKTE